MLQPEHYKKGQQPLDYMKNSFTKEEYEGFLKGNIIKYVSRYKYKNGHEDLIKAQTYLSFLIESQE